jgi:hypothetical protein
LAFSYWTNKPWFLTKGKFAALLITPSTWGSQLDGDLYQHHAATSNGEHLILMIDTAAGTQEKCLVIVIEFQSCFPRICGFIRDAVATGHEVLPWMIVVVEVFVRTRLLA